MHKLGSAFNFHSLVLAVIQVGATCQRLSSGGGGVPDGLLASLSPGEQVKIGFHTVIECCAESPILSSMYFLSSSVMVG